MKQFFKAALGKLFQAVLATLLFGRTSLAPAATTVYTNEADFIVAAGVLPYTLNEFTNFTYLGWLAHPVQSNTNGISYYVTTQPTIHLLSFNGALSTLKTNDQLMVIFTSGNVTGAGGYLYCGDTNAAPASGTVTVTLSDGTTTNATSFSGAPAPFLGFLSDGPALNSLTITNSSGDGYPTLGHLYAVDGIPSTSISVTPTNNIVVSWFAAPTGFVLQASTDALASVWSNVNVTPQQVNTQFQVLMPKTYSSRFFRLKKQ